MGAAVRGVCARALLLLAALLTCARPVVARAALSLNATELSAAGDWLHVSWSSSAPQPSDFLALFAADTLSLSALRATSPLKMFPVGTAHGNKSFYMLNWRAPVRWLLLRGGLAAPSAVLAASDVVSWRWPNQPTGTHLAPTGRASEMRVQWTTHNESAPYVFWRNEGGVQAHAAAAETKMLRRASLCNDAVVNWQPTRPHELSSNATGMGWFAPGMQHTAILTGLTPGSRVTYSIGNASGPLSPEMSFVVPPAPGAAAELRFAVAADFGVAEFDGSNWDESGQVAPLVELSMRGWDNRPAKDTLARLMDEVDAFGASLVLLNGDISYARGFGAIWEAFMHAISGVSSRAALLTTIGNHESCWPGSASAWNSSSLDSGGECGVMYSHRFVMPSPASLQAPWFSFTSGPVHFVHLSTEHDLSRFSPQLAWLRADLLAARRRLDVPWIIVSAHRFFYVDSSTPSRDAASGRALLDDGLEDLLLQFGVDLTLTGHHHSYQRTCHVRAGACVPLRADGSAAAPVHIVAGHAGAGLAGVSGTSRVMQRVVLEHGYLRGVANATHLVVTSRRSTDGGVQDELVLFKPAAAASN